MPVDMPKGVCPSCGGTMERVPPEEALLYWEEYDCACGVRMSFLAPVKWRETDPTDEETT